jgi:hypothetical protein
MFRHLLRFLEEHSYPRRNWAAALAAMVAPIVRPGSTVVDAPCGGGVIALWLSRAFPACRFELRDLSEPAVAAARRRLSGRDADVRVDDVRNLDAGPGDDLWLLVNSWFLLDDPAGLVRAKRARFSHLVVLCDDVESENYRAFLESHPGFEGGTNRNAARIEDLVATIEGCGYRLVGSEPLSFVPLYAWGESLATTTFFTFLDGLARRRGARPGYWAGVFERTPGPPPA